jgi:hypothetical protein
MPTDDFKSEDLTSTTYQKPVISAKILGNLVVTYNQIAGFNRYFVADAR